MTTSQKIIGGLTVGALLGTAAGLLIAPRTGKETRHIVATRAGDLRHKAAHYLGSLRREKVNRRNAEIEEVAHE